MAREGMREVVLGDDRGSGSDDDTPPHGDDRLRGERAPSPSHAGTARVTRPGARRWPLVVAIAAVVVLVGTVAPQVGARIQQARLAPVLGVLSPLEPPLEPMWTGELGLGLEEMTGDLLVAIFPAGSGYEVVGSDPLTGDRLWSTPLPPVVTVEDSHCRILRDDPQRPAHSVICHVVTPLTRGLERLPYGPGAEQRLLVLDPRTGELRTDRSLGFGYVIVMPVEADLIVVRVLTDGRVQVSREHPVDGAERWRFRSAEPLPGAGIGAGPRAPFPRVEHGVVVVEGAVTWALAADDGRVLGEWDTAAPIPSGQSSVLVHPLPDSRLAVGHPGDEGAAGYGRVLDADGEEAFRIDGPPVATLVDDGSAADVLLTFVHGVNEIVALDAGTGARRWSMPANAGILPLVLERRLITTVRDEVVAVDAGSGERLWTALGGRIRTNEALMPDGRVALVPVPDQRPGGMTLTAVRLSDGRVEWADPAPDGTYGFIEAGGRLYALHGPGITRLN